MERTCKKGYDRNGGTMSKVHKLLRKASKILGLSYKGMKRQYKKLVHTRKAVHKKNFRKLLDNR